MFKYTDWPKPIKYGLELFLLVLTLLRGIDLLAIISIFGSLAFIISGIISLFRKSDRRKSIGTIALGAVLLFGSYTRLEAMSAEQEAEQLRIEQAEAVEQRLAEEKRLEELEKAKERERLEEQRQLKEKVVSAIEKVEEEPTRSNYDRAVKLLNSLEEEDEKLSVRLVEVELSVNEYEEKLAGLLEIIDKAETDKERSTYEEAYKLAAVLPVRNISADKRLRVLNEEITELEEEKRIAEEKAAQEKKEAEEKAERERAEQKKTTEKKVVEKKQSQKQDSPPADNVTKTVYIAPQSGTKYHFSPNCRGLNNANSVKEISLSDAKSQGYDLCGFEK